MMYKLTIVRSVLKEDAPVKVVTARDVVRYIEQNCQPKEDQWREMSWALTLGRGNVITGYLQLGIGGTDEVSFDKKIVAKVAIEQLADAIILVHNHPSGNCTPSRCDIQQTAAITNALKLFDIEVLDHVIIGDGEYYSFAGDVKTKL